MKCGLIDVERFWVDRWHGIQFSVRCSRSDNENSVDDKSLLSQATEEKGKCIYPWKLGNLIQVKPEMRIPLS